jgi:hypothetical protein
MAAQPLVPGLAARVRAALRNFSTVVVIDAALAASPGFPAGDPALDFDELLRVVANAIIEARGLKLDTASLHPEELTQLLKDETRILFCFFSVGLLRASHFQRLRGLGLTQTDHRILFCGHSAYLRENSTRLAQWWDSLDSLRALNLGSAPSLSPRNG